jgi:hypothetical protein
MTTRRHVRLSIDLDEPELHRAIEAAAARQGVTLSAYCLQAVYSRLREEGGLPGTSGTRPEEAARALDRLRHRIGPIGVSVSELISEGRRR